MAIQRNNNVLAAIHRETAIGVQATATGATQMRVLDSPGLQKKRTPIVSNEKRNDQLKTMPRLGYISVDGSFNSELTVGGHTDMLHEAILRTTWATSTAIGFSTMTIAITTNALTATSGSFITNGVRVGDIFYLTGTTVSGNHNLNTRVLSVTTLMVVVPDGSFVTLASTATGTMTLLKKATTPTSAPTRYSHTIEQNDGDADASELFIGCRLVGMHVSAKPGQPVTVQYTFQGISRTTLTGAAAPYFTSPTLTTGLALICEDAQVRYNGAVASYFTGLELDFQIATKGEAVMGSLSTPDLFDDDMTVSGTITALRSDFTNPALFDGETEFELSFKLEEPNTGPPKSCFAYFLPRVKIGALDAPFGGGDGAKIETLTLMAAPKVATTGYDTSIISIHSSAP